MTIIDHCTKYLTYLQAKYPVPCDVTLEFPEKVIKVKGRIPPKEEDGALITMNKIDGYARIAIYQKSLVSIRQALDTLGHEYKHILQYFVENPDCKATGFWDDPVIELDAEIFGRLRASFYCEEQGLPL